MSLETTIFDFCEGLIDGGGEFAGVQLHADTYEQIKAGKTIRIDELLDSMPLPDEELGIKDWDAVLHLQIVVTPLANTDEARRTASIECNNLANALILAIDATGGEIGTGICEVLIRKRRRWVNAANLKSPAVILQLRINPTTA